MGFPGVSESTCDAGGVGLIPGLGKSLEGEMATCSSIPAWRTQGQRSLVGYSPWGCKESDMAEQLDSNSMLYISLLARFSLCWSGPEECLDREYVCRGF